MTGEPLIYVVLPVHNRRAVTSEFVRRLIDQTEQRFRLILVDDGSTDGTAEAVCAMLPETVVIRGSGNWWWAGSLQQAYWWLRDNVTESGALVLIANDDVSFAPDFLAVGRRALVGSDRTMLLAQLYDKHTGRFLESGVRIDWQRVRFDPVPDVVGANCFSTRCLLLRLPDLLATGGFRPWLLRHYLSDYAFTLRSQRRGLRLASDPAFRIWLDQTTTGHRGSAKGGLGALLRLTFSRKSTENPLTLSAFILAFAPWRYKVSGVLRVWRRVVALLRDWARSDRTL